MHIPMDLHWHSAPNFSVHQHNRLTTLGNQKNVVAIDNVDVTIFERATKAQIEAEVRRCIDTAGTRSRFVLSTSCELPPRANPDCVKWFMEAAREYGRWDRILGGDRKSTRLNSSHVRISYAVFCLKKKN